jgi:hypothetical protein
MQKELERLDDKTNLAHLSFATAISYLEFRLPAFIAAANHLATLLEWYQKFKQRDAMLATELY